MLKINKSFRNISDKTLYVNECEYAFETRLNEVCAELLNRSDLHIITLSGPTCSGKTTTASKLIKDLEAEGADVHLISIDDFYKERELLNLEAKLAGSQTLDYDSINAIDFELLKKSTESILSGKTTEMPYYDFVSGKRSTRESITPKENSLFIFEGIQAIYPEVTALFGDKHASVYISVADDLELNGIYFSRRDIRLMRRLIRDYKFRGAKPEFTFYIWRSVVTNEDKNITPNEDRTDIKINSLMPYEIFLLKPELEKILTEVPEDSKYYPKVLEFFEKLREFDTILAGLVPEASVLREFIGDEV